MTSYLLFLAGVVLGSVISAVYWSSKTSYGTLKIDTANPEKDIYQIYIENLDVLSKRKWIKLKVDTTADLSHK